MNEQMKWDEKCEFCYGTGKIEIMEHVTGDNIIPGGFYEGSGIYRKCSCNEELDNE